ncbi:putative glycosyltransferase [Chryseobacterium aquaeductus]|uniref:Glycosyltransferase n=1 Tax=Chryseobacterium aquaeductus TaxID=2675056 RepID=A0A9N8MGZ3_9FLAO|nr:glycosyltransferase family 2 protein [Chryseobacterium aquaeductus]CAA7330501.1 putative glycosyltransferase [Chryseobacterium potabilaquae]CAD7804079.1 putative glycosyltransferase [Chryseobacterium aquaeductus]
MKKVYLIISAYNEEENLVVLNTGLHEELNKIYFEDYELVFVNDGSRDQTLQILKDLQKSDSHITIINQSKNFGHEMAMTAGLNYVAQHNKENEFAVLFMDADLQHPPAMAAKMIQKWHEGYKLILTQRVDNEDKGLKYRILGNTYYKLLNFLSDVKIPRNMPDFRLLDKKYVIWINQLNETDRMFRGMLSLVGLQDALILEFKAPKRFAGTSKYNFLKLYKLAIDSVIQFSVKPLRLATLLGFFGCFSSILFLAFSIYQSYINHEPKTGFLTLLSVMIFFCSLIMLFLGILGEYIGRIHIEVKNRPLYFNEIIKNED